MYNGKKLTTIHIVTAVFNGLKMIHKIHEKLIFSYSFDGTTLGTKKYKYM